MSAPSIDDNDAFPSLGSASAKPSKKHHGKRGGHGHGHKENFPPSSLADIVKMSPSPGPGSGPNRPESKKLGRNGSATNVKNGENSAAAQAIPTPKHIPWLETGDRANKAYLKSRQEAIKHGGLRNKFLPRFANLKHSSCRVIELILFIARPKHGTVTMPVRPKPLAFVARVKMISCVKHIVRQRANYMRKEISSPRKTRRSMWICTACTQTKLSNI